MGIAFAAPALAQKALKDPAAIALLERSIAAHSAGPAKVRLSFRGTTTSPDQTAAPDGPFRPHPYTVDLALDEAAQALAFAADFAIDGGFKLPRRVGFANGRGFSTRFTGEYDPLTAMPADANGLLPHLLLNTVLKSAQSLTLVADPGFDRVVYSLAAGPEIALQFDRRTHLLAAQRRPPVPTAFGDRTLDIIYGPYRRVGQAMVPSAITFQFASPALGRFDYSQTLVAAAVGGPTAAELAPPAGARHRVAPSSEFVTERFGADAFLLRNVGTEGPFSYNVLVVPFADHVLVVEAALDDATSRRVIDAVARLVPGKPIRTLVQTHHHGDHIGGIRTHIAAGTRILTPAGTRAFIDRIAAAHSIAKPDALARAPRPAIVEEIAADRVIKDQANEVRLLTFPNDHSGTMLVVYLPRQRLIYQGDLISAGELPLYDVSREFLAWVRGRKLAAAALTGLHGRTLAGAELKALLVRGQLHHSVPVAAK